jgi:hypothetical protein
MWRERERLTAGSRILLEKLIVTQPVSRIAV